jgi:hypothetical protein
MSRPGVRPRSRAGLTTNPGQHKNKNDYYHSFKTLLESRPETGLGSEPGWPLTQVNIKIKIIIIIILKLRKMINLNKA